jgi:hypothetical protein
MKKISILLLAVFILSAAAYSQNYKSVKVTLDNGLIIKGKNALIGNESVSLTTNSGPKTYSLDEVTLIQAKQGKAGSWALGCGAGCLAFELIYGAANGFRGVDLNGNETSVGQFLVGAAFETAIGAGIGYLIGAILDKEEVVYLGSKPKLSNLNFNVSTDRLTKYDPLTTGLKLSCRF